MWSISNCYCHGLLQSFLFRGKVIIGFIGIFLRIMWRAIVFIDSRLLTSMARWIIELILATGFDITYII